MGRGQGRAGSVCFIPLAETLSLRPNGGGAQAPGSPVGGKGGVGRSARLLGRVAYGCSFPSPGEVPLRCGGDWLLPPGAGIGGEALGSICKGLSSKWVTDS